MRRSVLAAGLVALAALLSDAATSRAADERSFRLVVVAAAPKAAPQIFTVRKGDRVHIELVSDARIEVHLHGYSISGVAAPDRAAEFRFVAHATGRFPIHVHRAGEDGFHRHAPPAAYVDVLPQ